MISKLRYSELLNDILGENINKCVCPVKYMSSLQYQKPKVKSGECLFGPNCEFSSTCKHNKLVCTCQPQCTCEHRPQRTETTGESSVYTEPKCICDGTCLCKSEELLMPKSYLPLATCDQSDCICVGTCICKSEELLENKSYKPITHCDYSNDCICSVCLCQEQHNATEHHLFPCSFRNTVKNEAFAQLADEKMKKECAEIKKLITDHRENMKIKHGKSIPQLSTEEMQPTLNTLENKITKRVPSVKNTVSLITSDNKPSLESNPDRDIELPSSENVKNKSGTRPYASTVDDTKKNVKKHGRKSQRRVKTLVRHQQRACSEKSKSTYYSFGRTLMESKPPKIRYYYSGHTEHYGVKLGHKHCRDLPHLVPKNMGWLWNIEDPGKGIRERKGWPPGFIGKNIKNMMKVLRKFSDQDAGVSKKDDVHTKRWDTVTEVDKKSEQQVEPPLIHVHKKGRVYNITFCPKNSDEDVGPIPIPFSITQKKHNSDTESSESTLEFELHSPKPLGKPKPLKGTQMKMEDKAKKKVDTEISKTEVGPTETVAPTSIAAKTVATRKKVTIPKKSEENRNLWEDQSTQVQKMNTKEKQNGHVEKFISVK